MMHHMASLFLVLMMTVGWCASPTEAQTKPNLTGTWKMNTSKSKLDNGPEAITIKFDQQEPNLRELLTITGAQGEQTVDFKYTTDGKESVNQIRDDTAKCTAKWEGEALVIEWKMGERSFRRKFTLSADGKMMTVAVHHVRPDGEKDETVVLEKQ